jgi:hypothetical protein
MTNPAFLKRRGILPFSPGTAPAGGTSARRPLPNEPISNPVEPSQNPSSVPKSTIHPHRTQNANCRTNPSALFPDRQQLMAPAFHPERHIFCVKSIVPMKHGNVSWP